MTQESEPTVPEVDVRTAYRGHQGGAALIDVRQPDEYDEVHAAGAVLIPLGEVPERTSEIPSDRTVYLICRSGSRSMKAGELLAAQGYDAVNVGGGTNAWVDAGLPTERGG